MQFNVIRRDTCRVCGSKSLIERYSFGDLHISTFLVAPTNLGAPKAPLELVECVDCSLVQLRHTAPQELMWRGHYWYKSGLNPVIAKDLGDIVKKTLKYARPCLGDAWLDIGANDGTLLEAVGAQSPGMNRIGCEPAKNLQEDLARHAHAVIDGFWDASKWRRAAAAKVVSAIGMFYDMEDPNQFVADVAKVLDPEGGVFVAQMMTLKQMIEKADVGNVCHEHIEYYTYRSLVMLYERNGLEIFRVEENAINGGSYRLFARKVRKGLTPKSVAHPEPEVDWKDWIDRIEHNMRKTREIVFTLRDEHGAKVYAYGASTKGNTIMQWYGFGPGDIIGAADKSREKIGKFCVGSLVPVVSEDEARRNATHMLVLPYAFLETFKKREAKWLDRGGKFIVCTPKAAVI